MNKKRNGNCREGQRERWGEGRVRRVKETKDEEIVTKGDRNRKDETRKKTEDEKMKLERQN